MGQPAAHSCKYVFGFLSLSCSRRKRLDLSEGARAVLISCPKTV
jgi:hypothetical protein